MDNLKVKIYNQDGNAVGEEKLDPRIFGVTPNLALVHQVVNAQQANARKAIAHTKDRGDVSGGGKKPWRQKGTGRARHGSTRSPIWVGGGVTFGPRSDRNFSEKVNKKMKSKALLMSLTDKVIENHLVLLDKFALSEYKTKRIADLLKKLPVAGSTLFVLPAADHVIVKSATNLPKITTSTVASLNILDVIKAGTVLTTVEALGKMSEKFLKADKKKK